jgi:glycerol kinase
MTPAPRCVIAIDAGTTGVRSRAIFPGADGPVVASYREFTQHYPEPGWSSTTRRRSGRPSARPC